MKEAEDRRVTVCHQLDGKELLQVSLEYYASTQLRMPNFLHISMEEMGVIYNLIPRS
jgi:hypothetical protein